tara:strand:+ start:349 stop:660 length:312 start_codon:yes stop_codon:yes gene_type:complete
MLISRYNGNQQRAEHSGVSVIPIHNVEAIKQLDRLRDMLLSGEATRFYAFTDITDMKAAVVCGGDWDVTEIIGALSAIQGMELKACLDSLFEMSDEIDGEGYT